MGLFNALRRIQIKKSLRSPTRVPGCGPGGSQARPAPFSLPPDLPTAGLVLAVGSDIPRVSFLEKLLQGSSSVSCWQQKFPMLWRRETGPKRHGRACPGYPRVSAQRTTARGGEGKKALFLRPLRPRAARCLDSSLRRRGVGGGGGGGRGGGAWMAGTSPARTGGAPRRVGSSPPTATL